MTAPFRVLEGGKAEQTKTRLIEAAREAFGTVGYSGTGLREVAAAAGVNVALIGRYFGGKQGLFEQALLSVTDAKVMLSWPREQFGRRMVDLLSTTTSHTLPMMLLATVDPSARDLAVDMLQERLILPLAAWIGSADAEDRATRIMILCSGFMTHLRLLPIPVAGSEESATWVATQLQMIVDEAKRD